MKNTNTSGYAFYAIKKYRELTRYYLDMGFSYELAQKLAFKEVWG